MSRTWSKILGLSICVLAAAIVAAQFKTSSGVSPAAEPEDVLKSLRPGHPRLYVTEADVSKLKAAVHDDAEAKRWHDALEAKAEKMLAEPLVEHKLIGPRLLNQSRAALRRIGTLAFLYRLDGDSRKAARVREEMLATAGFADWNPSHFLDTAEMTHALAIGYDWLYGDLSAEDRAVIRKAMVEKGLKAGLEAFNKNAWWTKTRINWNQVCNGGLTLGALAIADEEPDLAREMINRSRASIAIAMRTFAPDGGWEEGPGYWSYTTEYTAAYLAGIESALGTDFGFEAAPGFSETGLFRVHSVGPLGLTFNFADASPEADEAPQMFWLARRFKQPLYTGHERTMMRASPKIFHLIWWPGPPPSTAIPKPPLDARYQAINVAFFRSRWDDPNAVYVGFKGGDNKANHSHLDLGTFVLDALGERWALDLGPDDYDLPEYFGKLRWTYYRLRTEGHNTLTIAGENQNPSAQAPIVAYLSTPERAFAVADLTAAYSPKVKRAMRGVSLLGRRQVLVEDEIETTEPAEIIWNFHTRAGIELEGARATLSQGKARLNARLLSPEEARFEVISANPPPPQAQQPEVHNLVVRLPKRQGKWRLAVVLSPDGIGATPAVEPLETWIAAVSGKE